MVYISFLLYDESDQLDCLLKPMKLKVKVEKNKYLEYDIFSKEQFNSIPKDLNFNHSIIVHNDSKYNYFMDFYEEYYDENKIKNNKLYIEDYKELSFLDKTEFEKFFENYTPILK